MSASAREKLQCVERELAYRRRVYPRLISQGRMTARQAQHQINLMVEIVADYVLEVSKSPEAQNELFTTS